MKPLITELFQFDQEPDEIMPKWYLSTTPYFFIYRLDKYDKSCMRASLYKEKTRVDDVLVSARYGQKEMEHHDIINYFEARLSLKEIS